VSSTSFDKIWRRCSLRKCLEPPDVENWTDEIIQIPRRDASKGDKDDYDALKRLVDEMISNQQSAKNVSIHNFTALATIDKPSLIYCLWPTVDKGYKANHLLKYWEMLRKLYKK